VGAPQNHGEPDRAGQIGEKAIEIGERLVDQHPGTAKFATVTGAAHCNRGNRLWLEDNTEAAIDHYDRAIQLLGPVLQQDDRNGSARQFLQNAHAARARALCALGQFQPSLADWDRATELAPLDATSLRLGHARTLALSGDHQAAASEAQELADRTTKPVVQFEVARVLAVATAAAQNDRSLSDDQRAQRVDDLGRRAVQLLQQANQLNFFREPNHWNRLKNDLDFQSLHQRDDFRILVEKSRPN
jgi:tetratricopeptide (TPR) repeat protein